MLESESIPLRALGHLCPFRGLPFRPELDERCPTNVLCVKVDGADEIAAGYVPIVQEGSTCGTCLTERIREKEAGVGISRSTEFQDKRKAKKR